MNQTVKIELAVSPATAQALTDQHRRQAVGRLIDRLVRPGGDDPLTAILQATSHDAHAAGLDASAIEAELAAYNAERPG